MLASAWQPLPVLPSHALCLAAPAQVTFCTRLPCLLWPNSPLEIPTVSSSRAFAIGRICLHACFPHTLSIRDRNSIIYLLLFIFVLSLLILAQCSVTVTGRISISNLVIFQTHHHIWTFLYHSYLGKTSFIPLTVKEVKAQSVVSRPRSQSWHGADFTSLTSALSENNRSLLIVLHHLSLES